MLGGGADCADECGWGGWVCGLGLCGGGGGEDGRPNAVQDGDSWSRDRGGEGRKEEGRVRGGSDVVTGCTETRRPQQTHTCQAHV